jgi:hypothetical protein
MPGRCFVINDWFLEDLQGRNNDQAGEGSKDKQIEAAKFLDIFSRNSDRIAVMIGSSWSRKAYRLMKISQPDIRRVSKALWSLLYDSNKCILIHPDSVPKLTPEVIEAINDEDDHYLFQCYFYADADLLVTTDQRLYTSILESQIDAVRIQMRDDFLAEYL